MCVSLGCGADNADYSKKSDEELIGLHNGKLKANEAASLRLEAMKRANKLENDDRKAFLEKFKSAYNEATSAWLVKDLREYEESVNKAFKALMESLSDEDKKALGMGGGGGHSCPHHAEGGDNAQGHNHH